MTEPKWVKIALSDYVPLAIAIKGHYTPKDVPQDLPKIVGQIISSRERYRVSCKSALRWQRVVKTSLPTLPS